MLLSTKKLLMKKNEKNLPNNFEQKKKIVEELEWELPPGEREKEENKWLRPKKIDDRTLQKLKLCFSVGMTDQQAAYFCGISERTLYSYQKKNTRFMQEKKILKENISLQARVNIGRSIKSGSVQDSWKWLEKKDKDFVPKFKLEWEVSHNTHKLINDVL